MKNKKGTIKIYSTFPESSLAYKLEKLSILKTKFDSSIIRLCLKPFWAYLLVQAYNKFDDNNRWKVGVFGTLEVIFLIIDLVRLPEIRNELRETRTSIAEHVSEIEPKVIHNEDAKQALIKRL